MKFFWTLFEQNDSIYVFDIMVVEMFFLFTAYTFVLA